MERKKGVVEICYQVVLIIYKKMHLWKIPVPGRDRVKTDLSRLYPGENQEERITEYYVRKLTMSLMIFFVGILLILFVALGKSEGNSIKNGWMKRADSGSGSKDYVIIGKVNIPLHLQYNPENTVRRNCKNCLMLSGRSCRA